MHDFFLCILYCIYRSETLIKHLYLYLFITMMKVIMDFNSCIFTVFFFPCVSHKLISPAERL